MGLVDGKIALVTGGGSGIGEASARLFAEEGAAVVVADIDFVRAELVAASIRAGGGEASPLACDVTDEADVAAMVATVVERHGRLDCAHNNAGISGQMAAFTQLTLDDWNRMIAVNLTSVFLCMKHELLVMEPQRRGAIVNRSRTALFVDQQSQKFLPVLDRQRRFRASSYTAPSNRSQRRTSLLLCRRRLAAFRAVRRVRNIDYGRLEEQRRCSKQRQRRRQYVRHDSFSVPQSDIVARDIYWKLPYPSMPIVFKALDTAIIAAAAASIR